MVRKKTIDVLIPSVVKIKGKIICVSSPRYGSHFNKSILENTGELLTSVLRADQIYDNRGNRIYSEEDLQKAKSMMSIEAFRSEYMVDLASHNEASIYGRSFEEAKFVDFPAWVRGQRVFISADLGSADNSAFTFGIVDNQGNVIVIDHYRNRGVATQHYIDYIKKWAMDRKIPLEQITLILPHDSQNNQDAGVFLVSRNAMYQNAGIRTVVLKPVSVIRTIELTRTMIINGRLRFADVPTVHNMMQIIKTYQWKTTPSGDILGVPEHGTGYAGSNDADSLEYLVVAFFLDEFERAYTTESGVIIKNDRY